jgi:hypothetical protein
MGSAALDIVSVGANGQIQVLPGNGNGTFQYGLEGFRGTDGPRGLIMADMDNDGILDVNVPTGRAESGELLTLRGQRGQYPIETPQKYIYQNVSNVQQHMIEDIADIDQDGWLDTISVGGPDRVVSYGHNDTALAAELGWSSPGPWQLWAIASFELVGTYSSGGAFCTGAQAVGLVVGDIEGNGKPDLIVATVDTTGAGDQGRIIVIRQR